MNYNDQVQTQQQYALLNKDINQQDYNNLQSRNQQYQFNDNKFKNNYLISSKPIYFRGKQNDVYNNGNITKNSIQGIATNHSFNGLFNQNKSQMKGSKKDVNKQIQFFDTSNNKNFIKSKSFKNFGNSSRLSNYQFITDSTQKSNQNQIQIHPQTQKFIMKYFSDNYNSNDFYQQYISLSDFIDILFEEYQNVIGKSNNVNLIEDFTNKIYMIFGQQIFFEDLFEKTIEHGLIGLILEAFKSIQQDDAERKNVKLSYQIKPKHTIIDSRYQNNPSNKNLNNFNNLTKNALSRLTIDSSMNSQQLKNPITKISLDKYFSNQNSKMNIFDNSSQFNQQDLEDIKNLLSDYIQGMYDEAEKKLNKKYSNEFKKLSLKYKDTEKLLQKINQKISHHYDTLSTIKQYQKKIKTMKDKEIELQNKIKYLQSQCKGFKDQCEKQKQDNTKLTQQIQKLNKKMQKYQNAFFQKAMQKENISNTLSTSQITKNLNISTIQTAIEKPKVEFKIDNYTQHRPIVSPNISSISNNIRSYSPYLQRQFNIPTTPKQFKQPQRGSVSPLGKRISFNQPQNNIAPLNNINPMNPNLQISTVQRLQIGDPIMLRPTSPIGILQPSMNQILNQRNNQNHIFTTSRITSVSPMRR